MHETKWIYRQVTGLQQGESFRLRRLRKKSYLHLCKKISSTIETIEYIRFRVSDSSISDSRVKTTDFSIEYS